MEKIISPSNKKNTISMWHGGNLKVLSDTMKFKKGRIEYGPGLYLTSHYNTALKYSKGSRKLYLVTINKGNEAKDVILDKDKVLKFVNSHVLKKLRPEVLQWLKKDVITGSAFITILINLEAITTINMEPLRRFLIENGVDYILIYNAFGWGELMMVLFNLSLIEDYQPVDSGDTITQFDLSGQWN